MKHMQHIQEQHTQDSIQSIVTTAVQDIVTAWSGELIEPIQLNTHLVQDLNFASVDFIQLIVAIEDRLGQKLGFHDLLMPNDTYIEDLSIQQLIAFMNQKLTMEPSNASLQPSTLQSSTFESSIDRSTAQPTESSTLTLELISDEEKLSETAIATFQQTIPCSQRQPNLDNGKNPKAIFVLSAPRSGSTLLRIILAGNSALFAPPELHLLDYNDLVERKAALDNELNSHLLEGAIRAIMQLQDCNAEAAQGLMQSYEDQKWSTKAFYRQLQHWAGDKILVDKTPTYAFRSEYLSCAEAEFDQPFYIHLVRHPYGMIRSFEDAELDKLIPFMRKSNLPRRQLAELLWLTSNRIIACFLQTVPVGRQLRVRYEELVTLPESTIKQICHGLDIRFDQSMLNPYEEKKQRMTDGVQAVSRFSGDLKFHLHQRINPEMADRWRKFHTVDFLSDPTWHLATSFGYEE